MLWFEKGKRSWSGSGVRSHIRKKVGDFFICTLFSTLLHLPPLRLHCIRGCWGPTQDCHPDPQPCLITVENSLTSANLSSLPRSIQPPLSALSRPPPPSSLSAPCPLKIIALSLLNYAGWWTDNDPEDAWLIGLQNPNPKFCITDPDPSV